MADLTFVSSLPSYQKGRPSKYTPIIQSLQSRAGEWAIVDTKPSHSSAHSVRVSLKRLGADVAVRSDPEGSGVIVFARWPTTQEQDPAGTIVTLSEED